MRSVTLGTLVTRCQQRADRENDSSIGATEWKTLISEMVGEMQALVSSAGMRYFETTATITATGASSYTLPTDHLAVIGISFVYDAAGRQRPLREIMPQERDNLLGQTGEARFYAIVGQTIELYPVPSSGTYKHTYIPQPTDLGSSADGTSVDLVTPDGEAFVVWGVAVKSMAKSQDNVEVAMTERDAARRRLYEWAVDRSFQSPRRQMIGSDSDYPRDPADWRYP